MYNELCICYFLNWRITRKGYTVVESALRVKAESNKVKD